MQPSIFNFFLKDVGVTVFLVYLSIGDTINCLIKYKCEKLMNNQDLKNLIEKYLNGTLEASEAQQLEQWLDAAGDEHAFDAMPEAEKDAARIAGYHHLVERINKHKQPGIIRPLLRYWKAAACIACIVIAGAVFSKELLNMVAPHRLVSLQSIPGKTKKHILSDGSIVWLKGNSKLIFPASFGAGNREVTLQGEALFEIAKDPRHPFLVKCGTLTTTVLGTSFNIRETGKETQITLLTGKIALSAPQSAPVVLYPEQQAVYAATGTAIRKQEEGTPPINDITKGTEYNMAFNDATMQQVLQRIENKFEVDIQLQDAVINSNLITADFTDQSLQHTMEMISQALNLDFSIKGKTILLKQKK